MSSTGHLGQAQKLNMSNKVSLQTTPLKVRIDTYREQEEGDFSDESYSQRPDTHSSHTIVGVTGVHSSDHSWDVIGHFPPPEKDTPVYIVMAEYDSGDSFGHDYNHNTDIIAAFLTAEKAQRCAAQIQADNDLRKLLAQQRRYGSQPIHSEQRLNALEAQLAQPLGVKTVKTKKGTASFKDVSTFLKSCTTFQDEQDVVHTVYPSWTGYFESLNTVGVTECPFVPEHIPAQQFQSDSMSM